MIGFWISPFKGTHKYVTDPLEIWLVTTLIKMAIEGKIDLTSSIDFIIWTVMLLLLGSTILPYLALESLWVPYNADIEIEKTI